MHTPLIDSLYIAGMITANACARALNHHGFAGIVCSRFGILRHITFGGGLLIGPELKL